MMLQERVTLAEEATIDWLPGTEIFTWVVGTAKRRSWGFAPLPRVSAGPPSTASDIGTDSTALSAEPRLR